MKRRGVLEDQGVDGGIMLKYILKELQGVEWINLAQDRGK